MFRKSVFVVILLLATSTTVIAAEIVKFKGTDTTKEGTPLMLRGRLTKPQGKGPFPAIVMLHGCGGVNTGRDTQWAERLASWGYATLQVYSFRSRGMTSICDDIPHMSFMIPRRVKDACDAKSYLSGLPFIDRKRIALMGWSHGGWTALSVIDQKRDDPFRSAVAFYPYCGQVSIKKGLSNFNAPLLILIGEKDDWTLANLCSIRKRSGQTGYEVILKIYPDAYHDFDSVGLDGYLLGHRLLYNPVATADAIIQVKEFLAKHLK